jgi:hypothetical protein
MTVLLRSGLAAASALTLLAGAAWAKPAPSRRDWRLHPALAEPDGRSHRGDRMAAANVDDPRVLAELSRRFRATEPLRLTRRGQDPTIRGAGDFERRQEYFLRLLDHYWFSKQRLVGMDRRAVVRIFGPLGDRPDRGQVSAGRDTLYLSFANGRVTGGFYSMGY